MRALGASRTSLVPGGVLAGPWVRNDLWRRARAVPSLDLRFADNKSLTDAVTGASLVTFTRSSSGTYVGSDGVLQTAATNAPRFDHNPTTGESLGLLVEEQRTNLLLNSGTLSTQSVTVTAVAHTLSFTGTGTITLTGTSTAGPLVGTGTGESNRVSLTFTPTAGSLTLTVSGTVTNAQLEIGAFRTSYIPTTAAAATRAADVASISGSNFSSWYNTTQGTVFTSQRTLATDSQQGAYWFSSPPVPGRGIAASIDARDVTQRLGLFIRDDVSTGQFSVSPLVDDQQQNIAHSWSGGTQSASLNSLLDAGSYNAIYPSISQLRIGFNEISVGSPTYLSGTIRRLTYWPARLPNETLQTITQ
jgi:hypothetical protein